MFEKRFVIGVDYGTDSCRAVIVNAMNGEILADSVAYYPRWRQGLFCDPSRDMYRQHPLDYIECLESVIKELYEKVGSEIIEAVEGMSFDTTASTPVLIDKYGTPLALKDGFREDPDAMFVLWKDHTAKKEADEINALAHSYRPDYTEYSGGTFSAEWSWAKVLHIVRTNPAYGMLLAHGWNIAIG